jgi:hypothetical protein
MLALKNIAVRPPRGFIFGEIVGNTYHELVYLVEKDFQSRGESYDKEELERDIQDSLCRQPGMHKFCDGEFRGLGDVVHAALRPGVSVIQKVTGRKPSGCGSCGQRRKKLNAL